MLPAVSTMRTDQIGDAGRLCRWLEDQGKSYVLAVSGKAYVWLGLRQCSVKSVLAGA